AGPGVAAVPPALIRRAVAAGVTRSPLAATRVTLLAQRIVEPTALARPALLTALLALTVAGLCWALPSGPAPPAPEAAPMRQPVAQDPPGHPLPPGPRPRLRTTR